MVPDQLVSETDGDLVSGRDNPGDALPGDGALLGVECRVHAELRLNESSARDFSPARSVGP